MKFRYFCLKDFRQFKELQLNLTYPEGHLKAGQPLDKICFIGQSGTGKTTLLRAMRQFIELTDLELATEPGKGHLFGSMNNDAQNGLEKKITESLVYLFSPGVNKKTYKHELIISKLEEYYGEDSSYIFFPAELKMDIDALFPKRKLPDNPFEDIAAEPNESYQSKYSPSRYFNFDQEEIKRIWQHILEKIKDYKERQVSFAHKVFQKFTKDALSADRFKQELDQWNASSPNPLEALASKLNIILNYFRLEIPSDFNFEKAEDLDFIQIRTKQGENVPRGGWSTGTKQLVLTATPLLQLNTDKAVIFLDEPERSFYPDIQAKLVDFYTQLAPGAQLVFATHSPIVAAAFEPWEIVELKFNDEGFVYQEPYYQGEWHVDNYTVDPRYLSLDALLLHVFDMPEVVNGELRLPKMREMAELKMRLETLKKKPDADPGEIKAVYDKYIKIKELLKWPLE